MECLPSWMRALRGFCPPLIVVLTTWSQLSAQEDLSLLTLERVQQTALASDYGYRQLQYLCDKIGPRPSGSPQAAAAVQYVAARFRELGLEVSLEPVSVPHWVRGQESAELVEFPGMTANVHQNIVHTALGGSVATPPEGLAAAVVVVSSWEDLDKLGKAGVAGKIVLYNLPFDMKLARLGYSYEAYQEINRYRTLGAKKAAEHGAVASVIRSIGSANFRLPHTGMVLYLDSKKIPAAATTAEDADLIARLAAEGPVMLHLVLTPQTLPNEPSFNVIADLRGGEHPDQFVLVSAHLDSWDLGTGALDNASGVAAILQVAQVFQQMKLKPKRTIRFIAWMNEEFGGSGYSQYIEDHKAELARHAANIEIDNGSGHPVGYTAYANSALLDALNPLIPILNQMSSGIVQVARSPLGDLDEYMPGFEPRTDMRNYYDYHHTAADTLDKIDPQGLRENSALLAVLSYMLVNLDRSHATPGSK